ncbi:PH domain-containing protein [Bacillus sp. mrc49]|uniref:PH domain-containing protein n=1 Tax=Bacillus sp. mrc49 TaxID=2054913 RepID=UPI0012FE33A1|nr:PH domain-containing protein [Bacillus sp. mrc49]
MHLISESEVHESPIICLLLWIWFTTYYVIEEKTLLVRSAFIRKTISINDIKAFDRSFNPLSSPALSLDRIKIYYGQHQYILISPLHRETFIEESGMSPCRSLGLIWRMLEEKRMQIKTAFGFPPVCLMHHPHTKRFISKALMEFDEEFERMTLEAWKDRTLHPYQKKDGVNREER